MLFCTQFKKIYNMIKNCTVLISYQNFTCVHIIFTYIIMILQTGNYKLFLQEVILLQLIWFQSVDLNDSPNMKIVQMIYYRNHICTASHQSVSLNALLNSNGKQTICSKYHIHMSSYWSVDVNA